MFTNLLFIEILSVSSFNSLPNKFLNPDGTYSTLDEIFADIVDSDLFIIVDELPAEGDPKKIYLLPDGEGGFIEYHYVNGKWDVVGGINIDLSNYPTKQIYPTNYMHHNILHDYH